MGRDRDRPAVSFPIRDGGSVLRYERGYVDQYVMKPFTGVSDPGGLHAVVIALDRKVHEVPVWQLHVLRAPYGTVTNGLLDSDGHRDVPDPRTEVKR